MINQKTIDEFSLESKPLDRAEKTIASLKNVKELNLW
jgi:hypothetical protein